jgi:rhodanese-related sulfurtransferase
METIETEELKGMLENGRDFKLIFCLGEAEFSLKHIPGSICIDSPTNIESFVSHDDNIVVYCSGPDCQASAFAYELLVRSGYEHVRRFTGGIYEWEIAGLPLEGELTT